MNVLYVEDNVLDVDLTRREMAKLAPEISLEIASTMREAVSILNKAAAGHFQVVLSDLRLPDGDGLAVLAHIRERGFPLAVVLVTSSGDEETAVTALKAGANDYIVKHPGYLKRLPFTLENAVQQFRALASRSTRPLRVLYAEHNQVDVDLTRRHFARQAPHIRLDVVHDAEQIYQKALRTPNPTCEVILLDYRLPGQTGLDILKELRANHVNFPVVIVTGQGDEEVALQAIKLGALDYVIKNPGYLYRLPYILETARDTAERAREHAALEESQSLLFEMSLCRSRPFVRYLLPLLEKYFQVSGPEWQEENVYRNLARVRRSLIRMDADELTYPVHIMLRYELEKKILDGALSVNELPEAWNSLLEQRLGIRPSNDVEGCLQDIHWAVGHFGSFPSYALGAVIAGQLNEALRAAHPELDDQLAQGKFETVLAWLRDNVHNVGARLRVQELMKEATGRPLTAAPYLRYLETKYLET